MANSVTTNVKTSVGNFHATPKETTDELLAEFHKEFDGPMPTPAAYEPPPPEPTPNLSQMSERTNVPHSQHAPEYFDLCKQSRTMIHKVKDQTWVKQPSVHKNWIVDSAVHRQIHSVICIENENDEMHFIATGDISSVIIKRCNVCMSIQGRDDMVFKFHSSNEAQCFAAEILRQKFGHFEEQSTIKVIRTRDRWL